MGYLPQLMYGALITLGVALSAILFGAAFGLLGAMAKLSASRPLRAVAEAYTIVVRGTPDLIIILIVFFGGTIALTRLFGRTVEVSEFGAGVASLAFVFGAYATEIFRGAIRAVPVGQIEAARALSLPAPILFLRIVLPQAWRVALPAFGNQSIILLKQTSLISVVGLEELMRSASMAAGATREPFKWYLAAACLYLVMTGLSTILLRLAERRANLGYERR